MSESFDVAAGWWNSVRQLSNRSWLDQYKLFKFKFRPDYFTSEKYFNLLAVHLMFAFIYLLELVIAVVPFFFHAVKSLFYFFSFQTRIICTVRNARIVILVLFLFVFGIRSHFLVYSKKGFRQPVRLLANI